MAQPIKYHQSDSGFTLIRLTVFCGMPNFEHLNFATYPVDVHEMENLCCEWKSVIEIILKIDLQAYSGRSYDESLVLCFCWHKG